MTEVFARRVEDMGIEDLRELIMTQEILSQRIDEYITEAANKWYRDNRVAIEKTLRLEVLTELHEALIATYRQHNIRIPEDAVDVVEDLAEKLVAAEKRIAELEKKRG